LAEEKVNPILLLLMFQIPVDNPQITQLLMLISQFISHGTMSIVVVSAIQWAKQSPLAPWINKETTTLNKYISAILAFLTSIGIAYTYNSGVVTITFTVAAVLHGLWHFIQQYAMQHFVYHGFIKPTTVQVAQSAPVASAVNAPIGATKEA